MTSVVVCVCAFSKWVEAWPTPDLRSETIVRLFHSNVVCRFGVPRVVRTDRGTEYAGEFKLYLRRLGVTQRVISTQHPRANGLVERYNKVVKEGLRKLGSAQLGVNWCQLLPEVLAGLRFLQTKTGLSPFLIVCKQTPHWFGDLGLGPPADSDVA